MTVTQLKDLLDQSHRFAHMMGRVYHFYDRQAENPGMHPRQARLLFLILEKQPVGQKELVELLDIRPSSLSELLKKLEDKGLITRVANGVDKRNMVVTLTEEGKALAQKVALGRDELESKVFAPLSESELAQLYSLLGKLTDSWQATLREAGEPEELLTHRRDQVPHGRIHPGHGPRRPEMRPHHPTFWEEDSRGDSQYNF